MGIDMRDIWPFLISEAYIILQSPSKHNLHSRHRIFTTARNVDMPSYLSDIPNVLKLSLDVTSKEAITSSLAAAVDKFARINVVINNAGYGIKGNTEAIPNRMLDCR
ncbi:hypothetical protein EYZ11_002765 [Aspergillus tanneri]|uniref:Uncharacterized protein n=1 Tax=Aspergillus tanneri TaxID=1220188 RepID=A0A4S3JQ01_9EURO|nr:hypothetical protein EYZ11_002765 [Aspergillus tanneri]